MERTDAIVLGAFVLFAPAMPWGKPEPSQADGRAALGSAHEDEYAYRAIDGEAPAWAAPNRAHSLRSRVSDEGLEVFPSATPAHGESVSWLLVLRTHAVGREGVELALRPATVSADGESATLDRGPVVERVHNRASGIEQTWSLLEQPPGEGPLSIQIELLGGFAAEIAENGRSTLLRGTSTALPYGRLCSYDAEGRELPSRFVAGKHGLAIEIEDEGATYPVLVDPTLEEAIEGQDAGGFFGRVVASGDFDGDGIPDVVVGAPREDLSATNGKVFVYLSSQGGLGGTPWQAEAQSATLFGAAVAAGDFNDDGSDDLLIGGQKITDTQQLEGVAFLFLGSPSGLGPNGHPSNFDWAVAGQQANAELGQSVASGDVNGDGYDDVIVGAYLYWEPTSGNPDEGAVFVYFGGPSFLPQNIGSKPLGTPANADWRARANSTGAWFGEAIASSLDVNGDDYDDIVIGAYQFNSSHGAAYVYLGSSLGPLPVTGSGWSLRTDAAWIVEGAAGQSFGDSVSGGDFNGDGLDDVVIGAPQYPSGAGRAHVFHGVSVAACSGNCTSLPLVRTLDGDQSGASQGVSVSGVGDVNGDGYDDVLVGAPGHDQGFSDEGRALLYLGGPQGIGARAPWSAVGGSAGARLGFSTSGAGDLRPEPSPDGIDDLLVGLPGFDGAQTDAGAIRLYRGTQVPGEVLHDTKISESTPGFGALAAGGEFGAAVANLGDVDGDGVLDLAVGALLDDEGGTDRGAVWILLMRPDGTVKTRQKLASGGVGGFMGALADGDSFGSSVAGIGNLDGDSIPDMAVGARGDSGGTGAVWIVLLNADGTAKDEHEINGSSVTLDGAGSFGYSLCGLGPVTGPADSVLALAVGATLEDHNGDQDAGNVLILFLDAGGVVEGSHRIASSDLNPFDYFGSSIANLGDLDGIGSSVMTLAIGAPGDDRSGAEAGAVWLVRLNSSLVPTTPAPNVIALGASGFPGVLAANDRFGSGLSRLVGTDSSAAASLAVGATGTADNEGAVWVLSLDAAAQVTSAGLIAEDAQGFGGDLDQDYFGAVTAAGDLDGDGRTDLFVGAPLDDDGGADKGAVYVCFLNRIGALVTTWTGAIDSQWEDDANWTNGVPDEDKVAVIVAAANDPVVTDDGQTCHALWIQPEGVLTLAGGTDNLSVQTSVTLFDPTVGVAITGTGELVFVGSGTLAGSGTLDLAQPVRVLGDLTVRGGTFVLTGDLTVYGGMEGLTSGGMTGDTIRVAGPINWSGPLIVAQLVVGDGAVARQPGSPTISVVIGQLVGDLEIISSGVVTLDAVVTGNIILTQGTVNVVNDSEGATIQVAAGTELEVTGQELVIPGTLNVLGELRIGPGGALVLGSGTATIAGGQLRLLGAPGNPAAITSDELDGFELVFSGTPTFEARHFEITNMPEAGFPLPSAVVIDDLRSGVFDRPQDDGVLLDIERDSPAWFSDLTFLNSAGASNARNVRVSTGSPITFVNSSGALAGEAYDDDAGEDVPGPDLVLWLRSPPRAQSRR